MQENRNTAYQKDIKTYTRVGYAPSLWKQAQVQGLIKESQLTITGDGDQGLVPSGDVWTSPVIKSLPLC